MFDVILIFFSATIVVSLVIAKPRLVLWHKKIKIWIWHRFMIWKIENAKKALTAAEKILCKEHICN